ncbi:hypothetical protein NM688_g2558 [Phlebia brevispora]|uniref:Uncharacterized protein n=1 Tax=Phlebia brevispora TaxID=194682 RepID=A0ACC1T8I9_9APHY|nr:hypothetical protein NM688_g2558 [Phlebia brevispora]
MSSTTFPPDSASQAFVSVKAIVAGHIFLPYPRVFEDSDGHPLTEGARIPSFAFLITHPTHGRTLFDLGLRKNNEGYPPVVTELMKQHQIECKEDVAEVLQKGGVDPSSIKHVFYSHLHCDHVGDLLKLPSAEVVMGADAKVLLEDAYPKNPKSFFQELPAGRPVTFLNFASYESSQHKTVSPLATYEHAIDFFGDGSLYLVSVPGHIPGHMGALARVAPNSFVFLAADICHNRECYCPGVRRINKVMHLDPKAAYDTVARLKRMNEELPNTIVILAHEKEREFEMPLFPSELAPWVVSEIQKRDAAGKKQ